MNKCSLRTFSHAHNARIMNVVLYVFVDDLNNDNGNGWCNERQCNNESPNTVDGATLFLYLLYYIDVVQQQLTICLLLCLTIKMPSHRIALHWIKSNRIHFDKTEKRNWANNSFNRIKIDKIVPFTPPSNVWRAIAIRRLGQRQ